MQRHSTIGERIVAAARPSRRYAPIVRSAHERVDGTGYPDGLRHEQIPICSRIIAVVDAYDAMTSDRPYQQAMPAVESASKSSTETPAPSSTAPSLTPSPPFSQRRSRHHKPT